MTKKESIYKDVSSNLISNTENVFRTFPKSPHGYVIDWDGMLVEWLKIIEQNKKDGIRDGHHDELKKEGVI